MALVNAYCSVQDLRDRFADTGSTLSTTLLEDAINAASRSIDRHCSRRFWVDAAVSTRTYAAQDARVCIVDDISTATGLVVKTDQGGDGVFETTWVINTDFVLEPLNAGVVASGDTATAFAWWQLGAAQNMWWPRFTNRQPGVQVTAKFGWSSIPPEVKIAATLTAAALYRRKDSPEGIMGFGELGLARTTSRDYHVADLLAPFVKRMPATITYDTQRGSLFHSRSLGSWW